MQDRQFNNQVQKLARALDAADVVIIGAGAGLSTSAGFTYTGTRFERYFADFSAKYGFEDMYAGGFYPYATPEENWAYWSRYIYVNRYMDAPLPVYDKLFDLVRNKDYFVLTTNVDHCFQKAGFERARLFYTQGDYGLWQCSRPCHDGTYDNADAVRQMVLAQGFSIAPDGTLEPPIANDDEGVHFSCGRSTRGEAEGVAGAGEKCGTPDLPHGGEGVNFCVCEVPEAKRRGSHKPGQKFGTPDLPHGGEGAPTHPAPAAPAASPACGLRTTIPQNLVPTCPKCGAPMSMNLRADDTFVEDAGWHKAADRYSEFLRRHKNMRTLLLELGVGYNTPGIIKYPFRQMTSRNPQATYACVNFGQAQAPTELLGQSICINQDIGRTLDALAAAL